MSNHHAAAEVLSGKEVQLQVTLGVFCGDSVRPHDLVRTEQCDVAIKPDGSARYSRDVSVAPGEFASPSSNLPTLYTGQQIVVTQSIASALAVEHATHHRAVAALDANNLRSVASAFKNAGCDVTIVPDNFDLSRAAARDAARATGAKLAAVPYAPGQHNLLGTLAESFAGIRERFPLAISPDDVPKTLANPSLRMEAEKSALVYLVHEPIADAKPWSPGMGRAERITEVSRAIASCTEIGR
jgi:hypothetical protein